MNAHLGFFASGSATSKWIEQRSPPNPTGNPVYNSGEKRGPAKPRRKVQMPAPGANPPAIVVAMTPAPPVTSTHQILPDGS